MLHEKVQKLLQKSQQNLYVRMYESWVIGVRETLHCSWAKVKSAIVLSSWAVSKRDVAVKGIHSKKLLPVKHLPMGLRQRSGRSRSTENSWRCFIGFIQWTKILPEGVLFDLEFHPNISFPSSFPFFLKFLLLRFSSSISVKHHPVLKAFSQDFLLCFFFRLLFQSQPLIEGCVCIFMVLWP